VTGAVGSHKLTDFSHPKSVNDIKVLSGIVLHIQRHPLNIVMETVASLLGIGDSRKIQYISMPEINLQDQYRNVLIIRIYVMHPDCIPKR
jgi:hypothetical protein